MKAVWVGVCLWAGAVHADVLLDQGDLSGWDAQSFVGDTQYQRVADAQRGFVLQGVADGTASALGFERRIDPAQTPWLEWSWQVVTAPTLGAPEQSKAGDDYAARVYVVRKGAFGILSTQSLVYVHSSARAVDDIWDSPYTGKVKMLAVANGTSGDWIRVKRNLAADWQRAFGRSLDELDGVALMVDADNSGSRAAARFGQIALRAN